MIYFFMVSLSLSSSVEIFCQDKMIIFDIINAIIMPFAQPREGVAYYIDIIKDFYCTSLEERLVEGFFPGLRKIVAGWSEFCMFALNPLKCNDIY